MAQHCSAFACRAWIVAGLLTALAAGACAPRPTGDRPHADSTAPEPFVAFDAWRHRLTAAGDPSILAEGLRLAERRAMAMADLIARDPDRAVALAMPAAERDQLPAAVRERIERHIAGTGFYGVLAVCEHGEGEHGTGCLIRREARIGDASWRAFPVTTLRRTTTVESATIEGVALDGDIALAAVAAEASEDPGPALPGGPGLDPAAPIAGMTPPTAAYNEYTGTNSHQYGPKTVMVFLVEPSDGATWTTPTSFATLDTQTTSASQWWYTASYGLTWFGPKYRFPNTASEILIPRLTVTPVLRLPKTAATYLNDFWTLQNDCKAVAEAQGGTWSGNGVNDPDHYDRWVVMSNTKMISSTGLAYVGGKFAWTGGSINGGVANHEHGHNWGVFHANAWTVAGGSPARSPAGSHGEYGDGRDIMGGNSTGFNPLFLETLGFLTAARGEITTITSSGTYRLYDRWDGWSRNASSAVRALLVPVTGTTTSSKRIMLGFAHEGGNDGGSGRSDWERTAVTVHSDNTSATLDNNDGSHRLDTSPGSRQSDDGNDSAIPIGQTWSEPANVNGTCAGFHITPVARGSITGPSGQTHQWIDVRVQLGQAAGNGAPTGSISTTNAAPAPAQATTLTASASDPNGDILAYRWLFGDGTWSTSNTPVIAKSWTSAGLYRVDCIVSDMKGATTTLSRWVDVGNAGLKPAVNPGAVLTGLEYRYHEGVWTRLPDMTRQRPLTGGSVTGIDLSPRLRNDGFAFVYSGYLQVPTDDTYTFTVTAEDSTGLWIDGQQVVLKDGVTSGTTFASGNIGLAAGLHTIEVRYAHRDGSESLSLDWQTLSMARTAVPASAFRRLDRSGDAAPSVSLLAPGSIVPLAGTAAFQATAADADDAITKVQYFWNRALIGEATSAPWAVAWPNLWPGDKPVVAVAWAADGRWAVSAPATVSVAAPSVTPGAIGINMRGGSSTDGTLTADQVAGAVHRQANWTTITLDKTTVAALKDRDGIATTASATVAFTNPNGHVNANAEVSEPDGRLLDGAFWTRDNGIAATVTVGGLPWTASDVYVYLDAAVDSSADAALGAYTIGSATRYGRNSLNSTDQLGDWPTYDTWVGWREAVATSTTAAVTAQLGNYLVFRGVAGTGFTLSAQTGRPVSAVQVVEAVGQPPGNQAPEVGMPAMATPEILVIP